MLNMIRLIAIGLVLAISTVFVAAAMENVEQADKPNTESVAIMKPSWAPGELLVKFKGVKISENFPKTGQREALRSVIPASADQALWSLQADVEAVSALSGIVHIRFSANMSVEEAARQLEQTGTVVYAEPNYRVRSGRRASSLLSRNPREKCSRPLR